MINICAPWTTIRGRRSWHLESDLHLSQLCHCPPPGTNTYPEAFVWTTLMCCFGILSHMYIPILCLFEHVTHWEVVLLILRTLGNTDWQMWLSIQYTVFVNSNMFILVLRIDNKVILKILNLFICLICIKPENCLIIST